MQPWLSAVQPSPHVQAQGDGVVLVHPQQANCRAVLLPLAQAQVVDRRGGTVALQAGRSDDLSCARWLDAVAAAVLSHDPPLPHVRPGGDLPPATTFDRVLLTVALLLLGALPVLVGAALQPLGRRTVLQVTGLVALAWALRLLWPWRLTAVYFGYEWMAQAFFLDSVPRYGPGAQALWAVALRCSPEPSSVFVAQTLVAAIGCGAWTLAAGRIANRPTAGLWVGIALAVTPLFLRNAASESMHVPALTATAMACWAAVERVRATEPHLALRYGVLLVVGLGYAGLCRADMLPWSVAAVAACVWVAEPQAVSHLRRHGLLLAAALALPVLTLWRAGGAAQQDLAAGNLPQLASYAHDLPRHLLQDAVLWRPDWLPLGLWVPVVLWLAVGRSSVTTHHRWLVLLPVAVLGMAASWLDYNETSLPRLQEPAAQLALVCAAALTAQFTLQQRWLAVLSVIAFVGSAGATLPAVLRETAAHQEEALIARAVATLPRDQAGLLAVRSYADGPAVGLHLHWPTWRFSSQQGGLRLVSVSAVADLLRQGARVDVPLYLLRSVRCYAQPLDRPRAQAQHGEYPACAALAQHATAKPLWEAELPNLGDTATFDWYGREPTYRVGLYRLNPP